MVGMPSGILGAGLWGSGFWDSGGWFLDCFRHKSLANPATELLDDACTVDARQIKRVLAMQTLVVFWWSEWAGCVGSHFDADTDHDWAHDAAILGKPKPSLDAAQHCWHAACDLSPLAAVTGMALTASAIEVYERTAPPERPRSQFASQ